jgi:hypothetical protein
MKLKKINLKKSTKNDFLKQNYENANNGLIMFF